MNTRILMVVLLAGAVLVCGCGKKADENKPVSEVKAEAEKMDVQQLKDMALSYKNAIVAKQDEVKKLADKIANIPMAEKLGTEAKKLSEEVSSLNKSVQALTERFNVYYEKLKAMNQDVSGLSL